MTLRRNWARILLGVGLGSLAVWMAWKHGHDYVFPERLIVVEPGKIYRGAWQQDWPMRRIVRNYHIKTIVALAHPPDHPLAVREKALAEELGVRWVHVPIVEEPGNDPQRRTVPDALERAAALIADPANQPVFFHCHHGLNRASMAQIAYRTLYCDWPLDRSIDEIANSSVGLDPVKHGVDYRYMPTFYKERVLPKRLARAQGQEKSTPH